jgi:hypothetical protein
VASDTRWSLIKGVLPIAWTTPFCTWMVMVIGARSFVQPFIASRELVANSGYEMFRQPQG